jgi:hypothetical protein
MVLDVFSWPDREAVALAEDVDAAEVLDSDPDADAVATPAWTDAVPENPSTPMLEAMAGAACAAVLDRLISVHAVDVELATKLADAAPWTTSTPDASAVADAWLDDADV